MVQRRKNSRLQTLHYPFTSRKKTRYIAVIYIARSNINFKNAGNFNAENLAENIINIGE